MGSIVDLPPATQVNGPSLNITLKDSDPTSASMPVVTEELLLLSWLIVLLRAREDIQFGFDWAYCTENGVNHEPVQAMRLLANEVMTGLDNDVCQVAAAISRHITTTAQRPDTALPGTLSLLLSTASLSQVAEGAGKDEVSEHHALS